MEADHPLGKRGASPLFLDRAIEITLLAMLAFAPWSFGSTTRWSEEILVAVAACLALCFWLQFLLDPLKRFRFSWAHGFIAGFLGLVAIQLVPFAPGVLRFVSPYTVFIKQRFLADIPGAASARMPITFYRWATLHDLRLVLTFAVVFIVVENSFRSPGRIRRLLSAICIIGGAVVLLALCQDFSGASKIYWLYPPHGAVAVGGPFLIHSDFSHYLSLVIGAALALLLMDVSHSGSSRRHSKQANVLVRSRRWPYRLLLVLLIFSALAALCLSLSRAGLVAAVCAGLGVLTIHAISLGRRDDWLLGACVAIVLSVAFIYARGEVSHRLGTLSHPFIEYGVRWQIIKDIFAAWPHFPLFGTGLGTHEVVYPMLEHTIFTPVFDHAENEFAQMLEETGAIGLLAVLGFVAFIATALVKAIRAGGAVRAVATGLAFGFVAILVQSMSDFGQHMPAIALLATVEFAVLSSLAHTGHKRETVSPRAGLSGRSRLAVIGVFGTGVAAAFAVALYQAERARIAESFWQPARSLAEKIDIDYNNLTYDQFGDVANAGFAAHEADPGNIVYPYQMANYQWTQHLMYYDSDISEKVREEQGEDLARHLVNTFNQVRCTCPCYGPALFMVGQLEYHGLKDHSGADKIRLARELAPNTLEVLIQVAVVDCNEGRIDDAVAACRYYLNLRGAVMPRFSAVVQVLVNMARRPDLALDLAGDDPERQLAVVDAIRALPDHAEFDSVASRIETTAKQARHASLVQRSLSEDVSASDLEQLASIELAEHNFDHAIDLYQRALVKEYDRVDWHLSLARALLLAGRPDEAEKEAAICLRLQPHYPGAEQLIADITGHSHPPPPN